MNYTGEPLIFSSALIHNLYAHREETVLKPRGLRMVVKKNIIKSGRNSPGLRIELDLNP